MEFLKNTKVATLYPDIKVRSGRPTVVCLCGSTRFHQEWLEANYRETMMGHIVLSVAFYPHGHEHGETVGITPEQKVMLDNLYRRKIDLADEILVLNVGGYVGESTKKEIEYARSQNKAVRWLEGYYHQGAEDGWDCPHCDRRNSWVLFTCVACRWERRI